MGREKHLIFDSVRLDAANECLRKGSRTIKLRPKAFAVLNHLLLRSGQLVTKDELLNAVWPETFVTEAVLKVAIRQLREALDDDPKCPRFIETAHRRGYRFIGQLAEDGQMLASNTAIRGDAAAGGLSLGVADNPPGVVGRDDALSLMQSFRDRMAAGERQIVFVTGEAGIGKTALVDTFARSLASDRTIRIGRGQCLERYGTSEAYLPVLEAIGRLCREQEPVVDVLRAHAPMWLLQMPSLVTASDREALTREVLGATKERMLREMGEALEVLTAEMSLVLILEDLHWSDYSTLDLISYLASQRQPAHLMLIGTYRTVELIVKGHPLKAVKQELLARQQCDEVPLTYLSTEAVSEYLSARFPGNRFPAGLAGLIHERTDGNPLFMVNAVDYLVAAGLIAEYEQYWELGVEIEKVELGVPESVRQMIEKQIDHLDAEDQRMLEAASVAGAEFSTLAVVAAVDEDRASVEARFDELARHHQFIKDCGVQELPNGEAASRYGFIHVLYQNVLYDRVSESRRIKQHRRIAERGEEVYGERVREIATGLAWHFERGREDKRAVKYLQQAADNAIRRFAYREAVGLARRGLELLAKLPDTPERAEEELRLQLTLGTPLIATEGYAAPGVGRVYLRARELCQQLGETRQIAEVLWGLWTFHMLRAELGTAREIAEELLGLAERLPYPGLELRGHWTMEITFTHLGEFARTLEHFKNGVRVCDPRQHLDDAFVYALNPGVAMPCFAAWAHWFLGQPDQALGLIEQALTLARELSEPLGLAHALFFAAILYQLRRDEKMTQEYSEAAIALSIEHGLVMYQAMATITRAWALIKQRGPEESIEEIRQGLADLKATDTELVRPHFLGLMAEALGEAGRLPEGVRVLEEALEVAERSGERYYLAELYRLKGELLLRIQDSGFRIQHSGGNSVVESEPQILAQARRCFHESIDIAQKQKARSWELRAAMSLARLNQGFRIQDPGSRIQEGGCMSARNLVARVYDSFAEGFDTVDLREAEALLRELS